MKSLRHYLMESVRTYKYKIKVAGQPSKNWLDLFCLNLKKFDPVQIGEPKSTPIQKEPYGFPGLKNESISIINVEFKYPCTEPMVKQLARLLNYDENCVRMIQEDYDESVNAEVGQYENQMNHSPVLDHEELEDAGKQASKDYADQYMTKIAKEAEARKIDMKYAAPKTPAAPDSRKLSGNNKSPMTTISRQQLPATGATKSRG